jgi:membrane protein DedA with SNARE-associated domain
MIFGTIMWIIAVLCAVWVIVDVFTNKPKMKQNMKIVWTVCAVLFNIITAIVYYFVEKK